MGWRDDVDGCEEERAGSIEANELGENFSDSRWNDNSSREENGFKVWHRRNGWLMDNVAKYGWFKWKSKHPSSADYKKEGEKGEREREKLLDGVELRGLWSLLATRKALWMKCYFPLSNVTLNIWHVHINMNSAVFDLWPCAAAEPLMTLQQLRLLFFQLADTVWMEQHHVWSVRSKHGQYAKDSVIRDPQCAGREVSKAVNTSEEYPSPSDSCQRTKSATVNIAAGAGFKDTFNKNI